MRKSSALVRALALSAFLWAPANAWALSASDAQEQALKLVGEAEQAAGTLPTAVANSVPPSIAERVASGELFLRQEDYDRAIDVLNQVVELHRQGRGGEVPFADGTFLLGESYFGSKQYMSARRQFRTILESGGRPPYSNYAGRALSRLVDIALNTNHLESLDYVFERLASLPAGDSTGSLQYARGKALLSRGQLAAAKASAGSVPAGSPYALQAQYLLGVILTREAAPSSSGAAEPSAGAPAVRLDRRRYAAAIEQFRRVTRMPAQTASQRHVVDLAWMAVGRLFYESDNYLDAADAYSHVDRTSPEFSTMLYELAWVYVRLGDYDRAQRALEVLVITDPQSLELADGALLRADLMLRAGQFAKALEAYEKVRGEFDPIRDQVHNFLTTTTDPAVYYDRLTQDEFAVSSDLSPTVIRWAREEAEDEQVFPLIDDVARSRTLIKRSRRLVARLDAVLASPTRVKAFPKLKDALQETVGLINKLATAQVTLAHGMDDVGRSNPGGELGQVRTERRAMMRRMGFLPVTQGDFARRETIGDKQWIRVSQELQRLTLEADRLQATVSGLRRVLREGDQHGVTKDPESRARFQREIQANERDLEIYRKRIEQFREAIEMGKVQIGFGDQRYVEDDRVRERFAVAFAREVQLAAARYDTSSAAEYAESIGPLLARARAAEGRLAVVRQRLEQQAAEAAQGLSAKVRAESGNVENYAANLELVDQQARLLVGEVAMKNFALVRDRLASIVLRADVGIVQQAWELREEQLSRVRNLQRERAREEKTLNDELREVLDDAEDIQ